MTKTVRIENADTTTYPVRVSYEEKQADGTWVPSPTPPVQINSPTQMVTLTIWKERRIIIEERAE